MEKKTGTKAKKGTHEKKTAEASGKKEAPNPQATNVKTQKDSALDFKDGAKAEKKSDFDSWSIIQYPHLAEKSMKSVELDNKLVFIVDRKANKDLIARAVEKEFNVVVVNVNTVVTQKGLKKAYVKLSEKYSAMDIATRLGMV